MEGEMEVEGQEVRVVVAEGQAVVVRVVEGHVDGEGDSMEEGVGVEEGMGEGEVMQAVTTTLPLPPELYDNPPIPEGNVYPGAPIPPG